MGCGKDWYSGNFALKITIATFMVQAFNLKDSTLTNLRPKTRSGEMGFEVALPKSGIAGWGGWRPLVRLDDGGREVWLFGKGQSLAGGSLDETNTPLPFEVDSPGEISGAVATGESAALVVCRGGCLRVWVSDGVWSARPVDHDYPAVSFRATTAASQTTLVGDRALSGEFTGGTSLPMSARRAVCADLADAYTECCTTASAGGLFAAPVVVWCRYLDSHNRELLITPPVALRASADFSTWVETSVQDLRKVKGYTLSVPCFGIEAEFEGVASEEVAAVEVYATPCLYPYRRGQTGSVAVTRDSGLRISLPGYENDVTASGNSARIYTNRIVGAALRMGRLLARIEQPFGGTSHTTKVNNLSTSTPAADSAAVEAALAGGVAPDEAVVSLMSSPHTFGARVVASDAGAVLLGGIRCVRSRGYRPMFFASGTKGVNLKARAEITVTFAGKGFRGVVLRHEFSGRIPIKLGPILSYPSADADTMRITIEEGLKKYSQTFTLTPDSSGRRAVYIEPKLNPITLPEISGTMSLGASEPHDEFERIVAASTTDNPLAAKAYTVLPTPLTELVALRGSDTAWEFGRSRFIGSGVSGLMSIAVAKGLGSLSTKCIDPRQPRSLCEGPGCVFAALDGEVVAIGATSRKASRVLEGSYSSLSWDGVNRELLAFGPAHCRAINIDSGIGYLRPEYAGAKGMSASGVHFIEKSGLCYSHLEDDSSTSAIALDSTLNFGGKNLNIKRLCINMNGLIIDGDIRLSSAGAPLLTATLSGTVKRSPVFAVCYRKVDSLRLTLEGDSDSLRITSAKVK